MTPDSRRNLHIERLASVFQSSYRLSKPLIERAAASFGPAWAADFETVLAALFQAPESLELAAKGYSKFALDSMRLQKKFEATGVYPNKSYAQAAQEVYLNDQHMTSEYLPGLLLSHFLWPHHYRQLQFFDQAFLDPLSKASEPRFIEVGIGTGLYSGRILRAVPAARGTGYDISPSSCRYTGHHMRGLGVDDRYQVRCQDILLEPVEAAPWLVCVEVLEHLEEPVAFLRGLRSCLAPGGRAFITAAINAAHADHIYLYRTPEAVERHLIEAGFTIGQSFSASAYEPPSPGVAVPVAAAFVVC